MQINLISEQHFSTYHFILAWHYKFCFYKVKTVGNLSNFPDAMFCSECTHSRLFRSFDKFVLTIQMMKKSRIKTITFLSSVLVTHKSNRVFSLLQEDDAS